MFSDRRLLQNSCHFTRTHILRSFFPKQWQDQLQRFARLFVQPAKQTSETSACFTLEEKQGCVPVRQDVPELSIVVPTSFVLSIPALSRRSTKMR